MAFIHNEAAHTYHLDGVRLISTTDLLERMGLSDYSRADPDALAEAAAIGNAVSVATALLDRRQSWKSYSALAGYVEAWMRFKREFKFKSKFIEKPFFDLDMMYGTRPDRYGDSCYGLITVQIKTCKVADYVAIQTAAEERAIVRSVEGVGIIVSTPRRFGVELKPDGNFKPRQFDDPNDLRVFSGMLAAGRWLRNHGKWKLPGE